MSNYLLYINTWDRSVSNLCFIRFCLVSKFVIKNRDSSSMLSFHVVANLSTAVFQYFCNKIWIRYVFSLFESGALII